MTEDEILKRLCSYAAQLDYADIDEETIGTAKLRIFDSLVTGLMARHETEVAPLIDYAATKHGQRDARIIGSQETASIEYAALANSGMIRYLDWNDTYLAAEAAHPSCNIGALLAAAAANGSSGRDLLLTIVLAYEIQCRLCDLASFTGNGFDHVNYGLVSVPLAVGRLMDLDIETLAEASSISLVGHLGLLQARQAPLSAWKSFAFGNVARNGVVGAELAEMGVEGPANIFTGNHGIGTVVDADIDPTELNLGDGFLINRTHLKRYPICHHILAAIDAVREIVEQTGLDVGDVRAIDVDTYDLAVRATAGEGKWRPTTRGTADHSLPYCLARTLVDGTIGPADLAPTRLDDDTVLEVMDKVSVNHDETFTNRYGDAFAHRVLITSTDGNYERQVDYPQGHFKNPLTWDDVAEKLLDNSTCSPATVGELRHSVESIDGAPDVADLLETTAKIGSEL